MKVKMIGAAAVAALGTISSAAQAGLLWGNNASYNDIIEAVDQGTLAVVHQYDVGSGNGRGVVVVGNVVYYTKVGDNHIYKLDASTGTSLGSIATGVVSMSTIGWDGSQFWTSDYAGSNHAFRIDTSGNVTSTITLSQASSNMDGMEFFNGKLISNRCDACGIYDVYDLSGNLLQAAFITSASSSTGIAYDGTNFLVSNVFNDSISKFDGSTGALLSTTTIGSPLPATGLGQRLWEDLSVDYAARADTGGQVPEPSSILLAAIAMLGLVGTQRRTARKP